MSSRNRINYETFGTSVIGPFHQQKKTALMKTLGEELIITLGWGLLLVMAWVQNLMLVWVQKWLV